MIARNILLTKKMINGLNQKWNNEVSQKIIILGKLIAHLSDFLKITFTYFKWIFYYFIA